MNTTTATRLAYNNNKRKRAVETTDLRPQRSMVHYKGKYARDAPPQYQMDRSIIDIPSLWNEWNVGSKTVAPIDFLEREYGPNWRKAEKDRIWFNKRKAIIRLVHHLAE